MKKIILILFVITFVACKNDNSKKTEALSGMYLYYDGVAVLQTPSEVYGVILDDTAKKLNEQVEAYKSYPIDMVPIEIKGEISFKPEKEKGWPKRVKIVEILNISQPKKGKKDIITLGK